MPSDQETFDIVAKHLLTQGCKSGNEDYCLYRDGNNKCAAGVLIPDDKYTEDFEELPVLHSPDDGDSVTEVGQVIKELGYNVKLVQDLQTLHDRKDVEDWPSGLKELADKYNLKVSEIVCE